MSIYDDLKQANELIEGVLAQIASVHTALSGGWTDPDADGGRMYGPLSMLKMYCLSGGATIENRALWLFGNTAQLLNVSFKVAFDQAEEDTMMDAWVACQSKYFPGITSYLYPYPDGIQKPYEGGLNPLFMQWYSNQTPQQAKVTFEENIAQQWTKEAVDRWAGEDIEMMDHKYYSSTDPEQFLKDNPFYIPPQ